MKWRHLFFFCATLFFTGISHGEELKADVDGARTFNQDLKELQGKLKEKFERARELHEQKASDEAFRELLKEIRAIKKEIAKLEEGWRSLSARVATGGEEDYALWDVGEVTLSQLIMEYGGCDFLYIIPQELSGMKISLHSSIPLPRESWNEMIEMILAHNGVGIKRLNPFVKQLYILKLDPSAIEGVLDKESDLDLFSLHARLCFLLSPPIEQLKSIQSFFERFSDPKQTTVQAIGSKIVLISHRGTIEKLLSLYHAIWERESGKTVRLIQLTKITPQEGEKVLKTMFSEQGIKGRPPFYPTATDELAILTLPQGLVLIGEKETVDRGERILSDLELQLEDPGEKIIYWYTCKHSTPDEIASVLEKVYDSLIGSNLEQKENAPQEPVKLEKEGKNTAFNPILPASAPFVQPGVIDKEKKANTAFGSFVVDQKTNSILMVVRREELSKIKALLKKLDVPKKMVQLDVLLVEKRLTDRKQVGFNLLQIGRNTSSQKETALSFDTNDRAISKGILSFIFSRPGGNFPAANLTYNFLLAQDDVQINANPSVMTTNQTPASVSIMEEISINNGAVKLDTSGGVAVEQSFTRAQYGINIVLTPTIHMGDEESDGVVTLQTNLEFDTTQTTTNDRPPVTRRHIENEVSVADGETIILGGLRRKIGENSREKIPFLGDLPGIGKLFGSTKSTDTNTEMFIFITPHIIRDTTTDLQKIRQKEYQKRAGDLPEFLKILDEAKTKEQKRLFEQSLNMLFDMY